MKALFILYPQNVSKYQEYRMTGGYKFITDIDDEDQAWQIVNYRDDVMIDDDGRTMRTDNGWLVWELGDNTFDFGDYQYTTFELDKLQPDNYSSHGNMYQAIKDAQPWNMDEIDAIINENA